MNILRWLTVAAALGAAVGFAATSGAEERMKHSGTVVAIDDRAGTIHLAEIGPWEVRDGRTVITTLDGWPGGFVENVLPRSEISVNDYVTVDCLHRRANLIALKITVSEVDNLGEVR